MAVQINVAANQAALMQSIQAGVQAYNQRFANQNQINLQVNARAFSQPLGRITGDVKDFEAALAASNARVIAFGASTAILGGVIRSFKSIAEITTEVEKNLTDINRVFGLTTKELQKFSTDLFNVSKQTASSFKDASQAALEFSRQGVKAEQVLQRTTDALTLARLAGMNVGNAIEALTATVNGFATTGITTTQVLNKLVAVEQNYAVSAGDLAEALSRTGLAAQEAGVSIDELNALVTAAQEKTARGGAVIGNALKTIFTRLQRPETLDQLEQFNIAVRDVQGNILPATQILKNFAGAYQSLADSQRAQLSEQVAGVYQVNILKAIVSDLNSTQGAYNGALTKGTNATNEAQLATAKLNQSLDALLSQTSTVAQQFANNVGKVTFEPLAKYTAETFKSLFENLNEILEGEGLGSTFANGLLKGIRNILAGPGAIGAFFVLAKLLQNSFSYLTQALPQIVGITTETQNRKNIEAAILQILQGQSIEAQALQGQMGNQAAQAQLLLQIARQQTAEYQRQQALVASLAPQLSRQGVVVGGGGGGLRVTRSKGFLPNFEENSAKSQGATSSVKAVKGVGKIGGKSFIANNQEIQIPNFAGSGETAVIPTYGGGLQKAIGMIGNGKSGSILSNGFVPNFAEGKRVGDKVLYVLDDQYRIIDGDTIQANAAIQNVNSYRLSKVDAVEKNQKFGDAAARIAASFYPDAKSFGKTIDPSGKAAWNRNLFVSDQLSKKLVSYGLAVPDFRYAGFEEYQDEVNYAKKARGGKGVGIWSESEKVYSADGQRFLFYRHPKAQQYSKMFEAASGFEASRQSYISSEILGKEKKKYKSKLTEAAKLGSEKYLRSAGFIPNFGYAGADVIRQAVESGNIEKFRVPGTKTFQFPSGTASEAQVNNIAQRATKGAPGQAGALTYKGSYNFNSMAVSSADGKQLIDNAYENLVRSKIPNLVSAHDNSINFSLPFSGGPNSFIDFFDPNSKTFYEAKGGTFSESEVANKFKNARIDLNNQLNKQLQSWKNTLVYDPNYASKGYIPNFASMVNTLGSTAIIEGLTSKGSGTLGSQYNSIFTKLQKNKNIKTVSGKLIRQTDKTPKENTPVSLIKSIIPQIIRGRQGEWSRLFIGNNTFDFNSKTFDAELEKNASQILTALNNSTSEVGLETYLTKKSKQKSSVSSTAYDDLKRSLGLSGGFLPNFNAIKGRNIFQSKWLKEKAKSLGLNINDPEVMQTLGTLFAKNYPNSQMMFGFDDGFVPNFAVSPEIVQMVKRQIPFIKNPPKAERELNSYWDTDLNYIRKALKLGIRLKDEDYKELEKLGINLGIQSVTGYTGKYVPREDDPNAPDWMYSDFRGFIPNFVDPKIFNEIIAKAMMLPNGENIANKLREGSGLSNDAFKKAAQKLGVMGSPAASAYAYLPEFDLSRMKEDAIVAFISSLKEKGIRKASFKLGKNNSNKFKISRKSPEYMGYSDFDLLSKGFLPNFAYKNAVMNLEENLSGKNAILDNTTGPFPFIRNSGQPNFAAAINDHGGLGSALKDSYRNQVAAGLMNGGFIPNFAKKRNRLRTPAASTGGGGGFNPATFEAQMNALAAQTLRDVKNAFLGLQMYPTYYLIDPIEQGFKILQSQVKSSFAKTNSTMSGFSSNLNTSVQSFFQRMMRSLPSQERVDKFMNTALFAAPLIGGQLETALYGNRQRTEMTRAERFGQSALSTGLTSVSTAASIGNMILPGWGAAIGAGVGALFGLTQALGATKLSSEELAQVFSEQQQKAQENITAASNYIDAQKQLTDMVAKGASSTEIENATKKLTENFLQIKDVKLQEVFNSTGGDVALMTKQLQQYTNEVSKRSAFQKGITGKFNVKETAQALLIGTTKSNQDIIIKEFERTAKFSQNKSDLEQKLRNAEIYKGTASQDYKTALINLRTFRRENADYSLQKFIPQLLEMEGIDKSNPEYQDILQNAIKNFNSVPPEKLLEMVDVMKKGLTVSDLSNAVSKLNQVATESFVNIFKNIEETFQVAAFETAMQFERESSGQRINASVLEFTSSFNESLSSFLMSNIPDYARAGLIQQTARQKAELAQQKLTQDYAAFETKQSKERADALRVNAEDLTKAFKESMLNSQENAQYFRDQILGQLQAGNYNVNIGTVAKNMQEARISQFRGIVGAQDNLSQFSNLDLTNEQAINDFRTKVSNLMNTAFTQASTQQAKDEITKKFNDILRSLNAAISASEFAKNTNAQEDVKRALDEKQRKLDLFTIEQENAKKELQIQQNLSQSKIIAEMKYATEKAKIDEENMMRLQAMKTVLENLSNQQKLVQAKGDASVAAIQRQLNDPRQELFMGGAERVARRANLENEMMEKRFALENKNLDAEIQQAAIQIAVEQENTNALYKLNETIARFTASMLQSNLGENFNKVQAMAAGGLSPEYIDQQLGTGTYAKYQAYQMAKEQSMPVNYRELTGKYEKAFSNLQQEGFSKEGITVAEQQQLIQKQIDTEQDVVMKQMYQRLLDRSKAEKEILNLKQQQVREERNLNNELAVGKYDISQRLKTGFGTMSVAADDMIMELTETAPARFADNMTSALMDVAKGTKSIGDAFTDMAINFSQMLMEGVMRAAIYKTIGSLGSGLFQSGGIVGKQKGGIIRAENGAYIPGSRTGDRNLALLEDGEYVLNREAVSSIGVDALNQMNYGAFPRFQSGGRFGIEQIEDSSGLTNKIMESGMGPREINMSDYTSRAMVEDKYFQDLRQTSIQQYNEAIAKRKAAQAKNAQLISSIVGAVGSIGVGVGGAMGGWGQLGKMFKASSGLKGGVGTPSSGGLNLGASPTMVAQRGGYVKGYQSGGYIPYGSRVSDTVSRYMSGGSVLNTPLVKRMSGSSVSMLQSGGESSSSRDTYNQNQNSSTNISINVASDNKTTVGASTNSYKPNEVAFSKEMATRIDQQVKQLLTSEKRMGGILSK